MRCCKGDDNSLRAFRITGVSKDKDSGIINDANLWATETMNNPKYPLELFLRAITVSLETMRIVNGPPILDI